MNKAITFIFFFSIPTLGFITNAQSLVSPFEKNNHETTTYSDCIAFYKNLEKSSKLIKVLEAGPSDVSFPIHTVVISNNKDFNPARIRKSGKAILLINNGIHPGEPEGIDAAMLFARELVQNKNNKSVLDHLTIIMIPVYNIGGSLMRNNTTRVNQNGPDEYGVRGNSQNLDLNRDFIKCDSKNAETFIKLFQYWDPDVFLETHTTNGADYPYSMTLISSQRQKLQTDLGVFMFDKFLPDFLNEMKDNGLEVCPYVLADGDPSKGIYDFLDLPRYSTGYTSLFNTLSFMAESHMLKSYDVRVYAQKILMHSLAKLTATKKSIILETRKTAKLKTKEQKIIHLNWQIYKEQSDSINFAGYEADTLISEVTGLERIKYNPGKPYYKKIPFYNLFKPTITVQKPDAYIIPAAYHTVIERLKWNAVQMELLKKDTIVEAEYYKILKYNSPTTPYENHFLHSNVELEKFNFKKQYFKGDYIIYTHQVGSKFIVDVLEPQAPDSYFAWNFFDGILQRKEYFSDYLFEETALELLKNDTTLKTTFEKKKLEDPAFAQNKNEMLNFIYERSKYGESHYLIYPVARWFQPGEN